MIKALRIYSTIYVSKKIDISNEKQDSGNEENGRVLIKLDIKSLVGNPRFNLYQELKKWGSSNQETMFTYNDPYRIKVLIAVYFSVVRMVRGAANITQQKKPSLL